MPRYVCIKNPRTRMIHFASVEEDFGRRVNRGEIADGTPLPREAFARTVCCPRSLSGDVTDRYIYVAQPAADTKLCER